MEHCWHQTPRTRLQSVAALALLAISLAAPAELFGQGTTTASIKGTILVHEGAVVSDALVRVVNVSTGYAVETRVRAGRFFVQGLAPGGPYRVVASRLGSAAQVLTGITLGLGEERQLEFVLAPLAGQLDTVRVNAGYDRAVLRTAGGVGTSISDSALRRLPTLNRDLYDFVRLVPQAGTRHGLTGAGASFRYNSYVIDGVSDRQLQGNNVMGAGTTGGKTISIEAVREVQVLLSPYDARYGDFAGMLVNAVTKSGTNELRGSAYGFVRNEQLARRNSFVGDSPYRREQFGFSLGAPIVRNRAHFFIAPEFQVSSAPTPGPFVGQRSAGLPTLPVAADTVARFASVLRAKGLDPGDGRRVMMLNPAVTLFGRVDIALPRLKTRAVLAENYSAVDVTRFSRASGVFALSSNSWTLRTAKQSTSIQLFTQPSVAVFNELIFAYMDRQALPRSYTPSPSVVTSATAARGGPAVLLVAGPPPPAGGAGSSSLLGEISDHLLFQAGSNHTISAGVRAEFFSYHATGVRGQFGQWRFPSIDALTSGEAASYSISRDFGNARSPVRGVQPSVYATDDWHVGDRFSLILGLRGDALTFASDPAYNAAVDSIYHRQTSDYPRSHVEWSPRLGFKWEPGDGRRTRIRGGAGLFVGPPPLGWLLGPVRSNGAGVRTLTCSAPGKVPKFVADPAFQPQSCLDGRGFADGPVALVDRNLRMAESFRSSVGVDWPLPWKTNASVEALYTRVRSDFLFVNTDLQGPQAVDAHGRVLYGTIDEMGRAQPALVSGRRYPEVIDLRNHSLGHSWAITAQIDRPFTDNVELRGAYTWSRTRDVQSLINSSATAPFEIWATGRPLSGRHDELSTGISAFEIPHRVVLAATYAAPWKRWKTDLSFYYIGESGFPFTYNDSASSGLGDLNADGTNADDPIYVPRDATDPSEITFDSPAQGVAFEKFIRNTSCLKRQRGSIIARNSCRGPWVHTSNASLRQSLQAIGVHDLSVQVEVFNVLNLLNPAWGLFNIPNDNILQQKGQTRTSPSQPIFFFDAAAARTSTQNLESGYQVQLSLRYSF